MCKNTLEKMYLHMEAVATYWRQAVSSPHRRGGFPLPAPKRLWSREEDVQALRKAPTNPPPQVTTSLPGEPGYSGHGPISPQGLNLSW